MNEELRMARLERMKKASKLAGGSEHDLILADRISFGSPAADDMTDGGIPMGHLTVFAGPSRSGKSTLSGMVAKQVSDRGGITVIVDIEGGWTPERIRAMGLDPESVIIYGRKGLDSGEDLIDKIEALVLGSPKDREEAIRKGKPFDHVCPVDLIIWDSVPMTKFVAQLTAGSRDNQMMVAARMWWAHIPKMIFGLATQKHVAAIYINHVRPDPNEKFGDPRKMPGGDIWEYAPTLTFWFNKSKPVKIAGTRERAGYNLEPVVHKSRISPENLQCSVQTRIHPKTGRIGIDKSAEMVEVGMLRGIFTKKDGEPSFDKTSNYYRGQYMGKSEAEIVKRLRTDDDFYNSLHADLERMITDRIARTQKEIDEFFAGSKAALGTVPDTQDFADVVEDEYDYDPAEEQL